MPTDAHFRPFSTAALVLAASVCLSAPAVWADPQTDLVFSANPVGASPGSLRQEKWPSRPSGKIAPPRSRQSDWAKLPKEYWLFDRQGHHAKPGFDLGPTNGVGVGAVKSFAPAHGATSQSDPGPFGRSSFQFRTEKNFQTPEPFRRTDCNNEDECADYSGLPKFRSSKSTAKSVRKPYLGLSITTPIQ